MANGSKSVVVAVSLACAILASSLSATSAAAKDRPFTLFGSQDGGWGSTNTYMRWPGPTLTVDEGDNVSLVLTSVDGLEHNWYIDYDNDANDDGNEPDSPDFTGTVTWNFTADRNGTYLYRSRFGADEPRMWGLITVLPAGSAVPAGPASVDALLLGGAIAIFVGVLAVAAFLWRRTRMPPGPPPPPPS